MSAREKVLEFHRAMGQPILTYPQVPPDERVRLRAKLVIEECIEFIEACFGIDPKALTHTDEDSAAYRRELELDTIKGRLELIIEDLPVRLDLARAADAGADITYVVEGSLIEFGIDGGPVLDEVHRSNMLKASGGVRADGKILKPEGWTPPDVEGVLEQQKRERLEGLLAESFPLDEIQSPEGASTNITWGRGWSRTLSDEERRLIGEHFGAPPFAPKWPEE